MQLELRKSVKISAFSLIILDGTSESWKAADASKFKTLFKISSLSTQLKKLRVHFAPSPMVSMIRWFQILLLLFKRVSECFQPIDHNYCILSSSHPKVFLGKGILKICSKFTGEHPCQSESSIQLLATLLKYHLSMGVLQ